MDRSLKDLLLRVLEGKAGVSLPQFEAQYTNAINERRYHDAVVSSFIMYAQYQRIDDSEAFKALELLRTTIEFIVVSKSDPGPSGTKTTSMSKDGPYCTLCGTALGSKTIYLQ